MPGLSAIDLFCGAGGLSAGFLQEGYEIALGIDFDEPSVDTFETNFGPGSAVHADLLKYTAKDARRDAGARDIDVILGGPSCQPFSTHGRNKPWVVGDPRSDLWSRMHSFVEVLRPKAFVMENVPGMLYFEKGNFVNILEAEFGRLGYTLTHEILLAADYNVPQLRRRLIIVGLLGDEPFSYPESPRLGGWRRDSLAKWEDERIRQNKLPHITLRDALGSLPPADSRAKPATYQGAVSGEYDAYMRTPWRVVPSHGAGPVSRRRRVYDHEHGPIIPEVATLAVHVPPGGTWRDIPPHLLPDRFRSMRRTDGTNLYGRMTWDRPPYTMTTQFQNITTGCFIHPDETRPLTVREAARIQSFSDDFSFTGALSARVMQIGNAVPPLLARALARQLSAILNKVPTEERQPLVVGPENYRGEPAPGAKASAQAMRSSSHHDDAAVEAMARHLRERGYRVGLRRPIEDVDAIPDIVLEGEKTSLFVQGCFIYGCPQHNRNTKSQLVHWAADIARRKEHRKAEVRALEAKGWKVEVAWEHEAPSAVVERLKLTPTA